MFYVWPNGKFLIFLFQFGLLAIKVMAFWEISLLALLGALNCVSCMVKHEISNISPLCFGSLAIKAMAFWEILPLVLLGALNCVSCMVKCKISNISPLCFGALAVKARAFWEILLFSHQNLPFLKHVKISLII